jgi:hypothetical protein
MRSNTERFKAIAERVRDNRERGLHEPQPAGPSGVTKPYVVAATLLGEALWMCGIAGKLAKAESLKLPADAAAQLSLLTDHYGKLCRQYATNVERNSFMRAPDNLFADMEFLVETIEGLLAKQAEERRRMERMVGAGIE